MAGKCRGGKFQKGLIIHLGTIKDLLETDKRRSLEETAELGANQKNGNQAPAHIVKKGSREAALSRGKSTRTGRDSEPKGQPFRSDKNERLALASKSGQKDLWGGRLYRRAETLR